LEDEDVPQQDVGTVMAGQRTDMALLRTRLAAERTLDAWVRTALSMISFGFTIFKFLQDMEKSGRIDLRNPHAARNFGLALAIIGTLAVFAAIYQHTEFFKQLGLHPFRRPVSLAIIIAAFVALLGTLVILSLTTHLGPL
jgi:putative membrane protein